jgi:hypothetical protein
MSKRSRAIMAVQPSLILSRQSPISSTLHHKHIYHTYTSPYVLHFLPSHLNQPPYSWPYLELYNDICQCEERLNVAILPLEIADVQDDCKMFFHRIHDEGDRQMFNRIVDLACNIKSKLVRCCQELLMKANELASGIQERYRPSPLLPLPSQDQVELLLRQMDSCHHCFEPQLQSIYCQLRPQLISFVTEEETSDEENDHTSIVNTSILPPMIRP